MSMDSAVYEERYRLTWPAAGAAVTDCGFIALALALPAPLLLRAVTIGVFGWFAVATIAAVLTRRVAFALTPPG